MLKKFAALFLIAALAVLCFVGCGVNITTVGLPTGAELVKGETLQLEVNFGTDSEAVNADAIAKAAEGLTLAWASEDESVAAVTQDGLVTAVGGGETNISVSIKDANIQSVCKVVVTVPVERIEAEDVVVHTADEDAEIQYTVLPADADAAEKVEISAADEAVAVVKNGKLSVVAAGETELTIRAGGVEKTVKVTVRQAPVALSAEDISVEAGQTKALQISTGLAEDAAAEVGTEYTFKSEDEAVATVDQDGIVTGVAAGETTVTVENEIGQSGEGKVVVTPPAARPAQTTQPAQNNGGTSGTQNTGGSSGGVQTTAPQPTVTVTPDPTPEPAPQPAPQPEPTPAPEHYHGNGYEEGVCPACGRPYHPGETASPIPGITPDPIIYD